MTVRATRAAVIVVWVIVTVAYAWWAIGTASAPEGYVLADNLLMVFVAVRLPFFLIGLGFALWWVGRKRNA